MLIEPLIAYVAFGSDHGKVHRLVDPAPSLDTAAGTKTKCGLPYRGSHGGAGWHDYDETRPGFCSRCRTAMATLRP